jgi:predicted enzyme related to lactoylglutathione lyase
MTGPAQYGALIYSSNIAKLAEFYTALFNMHTVRKTPDFISLETNGFTIIIHTPPFEFPRESFSAIKLFLTVDNMAAARAQAVTLGGQALAGEWANPLFTVTNITDCDGNAIQLREFTNSSR